MIQKIEKKFEQIVLFLIEMMIVETTVHCSAMIVVEVKAKSKGEEFKKPLPLEGAHYSTCNCVDQNGKSRGWNEIKPMLNHAL